METEQAAFLKKMLRTLTEVPMKAQIVNPNYKETNQNKLSRQPSAFVLSWTLPSPVPGGVRNQWSVSAYSPDAISVFKVCQILFPWAAADVYSTPVNPWEGWVVLSIRNEGFATSVSIIDIYSWVRKHWAVLFSSIPSAAAKSSLSSSV